MTGKIISPILALNRFILPVGALFKNTQYVYSAQYAYLILRNYPPRMLISPSSSIRDLRVVMGPAGAVWVGQAIFPAYQIRLEPLKVTRNHVMVELSSLLICLPIVGSLARRGAGWPPPVAGTERFFSMDDQSF